MGKSYWMFVESRENFEKTRDLGFTLFGVGPKYRRRADRMQLNDRVLFYASTLKKWVATATIASRPFEDHSLVWTPNRRDRDYPFRVKLTPEMVLDLDDYIDALILAPRLEYVKRWSPEDWPLAFFDRVHLLPQRDFRLIEGEMKRVMARRRKSHPEGDRRPVEDQGTVVGGTLAENAAEAGVPAGEEAAPGGPVEPAAEAGVPAQEDAAPRELAGETAEAGVPADEEAALGGPVDPAADSGVPAQEDAAPRALTGETAEAGVPAEEEAAPGGPVDEAAESGVPAQEEPGNA